MEHGALGKVGRQQAEMAGVMEHELRAQGPGPRITFHYALFLGRCTLSLIPYTLCRPDDSEA